MTIAKRRQMNKKIARHFGKLISYDIGCEMLWDAERVSTAFADSALAVLADATVGPGNIENVAKTAARKIRAQIERLEQCIPPQYRAN